jgi:hypothetical protein
MVMRQGTWLSIAVIAASALGTADALTASADRNYEAGRVAFELDGVRALVKEASGGAAYGDVVNEPLGPDHVAHKHLAGVKYDNLSVTAGADMPKPLANWVVDTLSLKYGRKNGAILGVDFNYKEVTRRSFYNALLSEVVFPELDAASKDPVYITLKISPEYTRVSASTGTTFTATDAVPTKRAVASNFRMAIDGLDTTRVSKIEPIDIKMKIASQAVGEMRDYERQPASLELPGIVFYVSESHSDSIAKWHEDFVVNGHNSQDKEKNGRIDVLAQNQQVIYALELKNLGIVRFTAEPLASEDKSRRVKVEMYVEQIRFVPGTMTAP